MTNATATATPTAADIYVDPFPGRKGSERVSLDCGGCGGTGLYGGRTYWKDALGRPYCFDCGGSGSRTVLVSSARATARKHAKADAERLAKAAAFAAEAPAREAKRAAYAAAHPGVLAWVDANWQRSEFARSLFAALGNGKEFTEAQTAAVERIIAKDAEHAASRKALAEGRRVLSGTVVSVKEELDRFSYTERYVYKLTVEIDGEGARVYGSMPSDLLGLGVEKGSRVTFTATVKRSDKDEAFGFYSRPTKAAIVAELAEAA
jgi:hypothetical protein